MEVEDTILPGVKVIRPKRFSDSRGFFSETYSRTDFEAVGIDIEFVQDNHVLSHVPFVIRGLHFQRPPKAQAKLLRVVFGRIFDVVVDIRHGSPTFGRHVALELSAVDWNQVFVPTGCAHAYCTIEPDTEVIYKVSEYYAPDHEGGVVWNDPDIGIPWPVGDVDPDISERDRELPRLKDLPRVFEA